MTSEDKTPEDGGKIWKTHFRVEEEEGGGGECKQILLSVIRWRAVVLNLSTWNNFSPSSVWLGLTPDKEIRHKAVSFYCLNSGKYFVSVMEFGQIII